MPKIIVKAQGDAPGLFITPLNLNFIFARNFNEFKHFFSSGGQLRKLKLNAKTGGLTLFLFFALKGMFYLGLTVYAYLYAASDL